MNSVTLGQRLRLLIKEKRMKQKEIGEALGVKLSTLSGYINDKREPTLASLKEMAGYFNVTVDFLIGYSDERGYNYGHVPGESDIPAQEPENVRHLRKARGVKAAAAAREEAEGTDDRQKATS